MGSVVVAVGFLVLAAGALVAFAVFATDRMPAELLHDVRVWRLEYRAERLQSSTQRWRALGNAYSAMAQQLHDSNTTDATRESYEFEYEYETTTAPAIAPRREASPTPVAHAAHGG